MNGTRTARTAALTAALVLGAALAATALLPVGSPERLHTRTPLVLRSVQQQTAATPRTTPPPTASEPSASTTQEGRPAPATTVGHT